MGEVRTWDWEDGDAQYLAGVGNESFNFVHSSHCLEHMEDPLIALANWFRVLRPGGHMVIIVPDEDLYEQGIFPSTFNPDHKWTFTIFKTRSWSERSLNVIDLVRELGEAAELLRLELLFSTYRYDLPRYDQTMSPVGEAGIEFVIRKRLASEIADGGRWRRSEQQPEREMRIHLNQYCDDLQTLKRTNKTQPPFLNDSDL